VPGSKGQQVLPLFTLRTRDDAASIQARLAAKPKRVLIIGAGFIGSEMASVCRELDIPVTVAERASAPLIGALGGVIGAIAAVMQREHSKAVRTDMYSVPLPFTLAHENAGWVEKLGPGATGFMPGDPIFVSGAWDKSR